jgi:5-(carboxyamino)imidazole ribonucleotide mutase
MPPGVPVATVGVDGARNAGILAAQILATGDPVMMKEMLQFKEDLKKKIIQANTELAKITYEYKV